MALLRATIKASAVLGVLAGLFGFAGAAANAGPHLTREIAAPIYMNCPDFTKGGDSAQGPGWIEISSFQFGAGRNISTTGGSANREGSAPSVSEIVITKVLDKSSPALQQASRNGLHDKCTIHVDKAHTSDKQPYMTIELQNVLVSGYHISSGGDRPTESISLNFTKIEYKNRNGTPTPTPTHSPGITGTTGGALVPAGAINVQTKPTASPSPKPKP